MRSSYTICLVAQGGDFNPVIFSAHLFTYLNFCIPIAIAKSYFSWKQRNQGIWAMPQNQITLSCYGRKRIKIVFASLFVCLVEPVRITGRAIVDPRFSRALKSDSGLQWQVLTLVRAIVFFLKPQRGARHYSILLELNTEPRGRTSNAMSASALLVRHMLWNTTVHQNTQACQEGQPLKMSFFFLVLLQMPFALFNFY